jgi:uncharacterized protein YjbJ (UPF0337 family)
MDKGMGTNDLIGKVEGAIDQAAFQLTDTVERIKNDDKVQGIAKQVQGKAQEVVGQLMGDSSTEMEGKWQQVKGVVQEKVGEVKDLFNQPPPK